MSHDERPTATAIAADPTALVPAVVGALPPRAWVASDAPRIDLDGPWRFAYFPTANTGVEPGDPGTDWATLPVPAHWQLNGYGTPAYTNIAYPFPLDPPRVPDANPTGEYRRDVELSAEQLDADGAWVLRFEGVDSCLVLAVNGVHIGTSTGSRLPVEFDVTSALRPGVNLVAVRVHQWSAGSYLEDQDQWWMSGIFREVTLGFRPAAGVRDVVVHAAYDHTSGLGTFRAEVEGGGAGVVAPVLPGVAAPGLPSAPIASLMASQPSSPLPDPPRPGSATPSGLASVLTIRVRVPELGLDLAPGEAATVPVEPWSAEVPRLYDVEVVAFGDPDGGAGEPVETVRLRAGFRTVTTDGGVLRVNGNPVVLRGVNRHEFHPELGRALTPDVMEQDVALMKQHHINAVRTSHYPPHPAFLDLADEYGLYVVDECDIETHGFEAGGWAGNPSDDVRWEGAYVERGVRMVARDRNHPSIIMWSLGNEAGRGRNLAAMAEAIRELDGRPIHFEGDPTCTDTDVYSRMYASWEEVDAIGRRAEPQLADPAADARRRTLPFLQCEYAHAMGNGPGGLAEYEELFERYDRLAGGFVWEWIDHGIATTTPDGRAYFGYGGDFGEEIHDGSFICDGLLLPDRTPSPGLVEFAAVNEPLRIEPVARAGVARSDGVCSGGVGGPGGVGGVDGPGGGVAVCVRNRWEVLDTSDVTFAWRLELDGVAVASGKLDVPVLRAGESAVVELPQSALAALRSGNLGPSAGEHADVDSGVAGAGLGAIGRSAGRPEAWATVEATTGPRRWAPTGQVVGRGQVRIELPEAEVPVAGAVLHADAAPDGPAPRIVTETYRVGPAGFDERGRLVRLGDAPITSAGFDAWRPPTENDRYVGGGATTSNLAAWRLAGLDRLRERVDAVETDGDVLVVRARVAGAATRNGFAVVYRWSPVAGGVRLDLDVTPEGSWEMSVPRLGYTFATPCADPRSAEVAWFGLGPGESYADSSRAVRVGRWGGTVGELATDYVVPQENGARRDVRWATLAWAAAEPDGGVLNGAGSDGSGDRRAVDNVPDITGRLGLAVQGDPLVDLTVRAWSNAEIAAAAHAYELPEPTHLWVHLDAGQEGLGSATCGPGVAIQHRYLPGPTALAVELRPSALSPTGGLGGSSAR